MLFDSHGIYDSGMWHGTIIGDDTISSNCGPRDANGNRATSANSHSQRHLVSGVQIPWSSNFVVKSPSCLSPFSTVSNPSICPTMKKSTPSASPQKRGIQHPAKQRTPLWHTYVNRSRPTTGRRKLGRSTLPRTFNRSDETHSNQHGSLLLVGQPRPKRDDRLAA